MNLSSSRVTSLYLINLQLGIKRNGHLQFECFDDLHYLRLVAVLVLDAVLKVVLDSLLIEVA